MPQNKKIKSVKEREAELRGVGKMLDILWEGSYYSMGEKASDRIREEMIYYFGENWSTDMYKFIGSVCNRFDPVIPLKELNALSKGTKKTKKV